MSAPPEYRDRRPTSPAGSMQAASWPLRRQGSPAPRPDLVAALVTVVAGGAGVGQLFLSWSSMITGVGLPGGVTGWDRFLAARAGASLSVPDRITAYSVMATALGGAALILLGLAMTLPIDHRPLGAVSLALALAFLAGTLWWLARGHDTFNQSVADLFRYAEPGWYLFVAAGPIGVLGSAKALTTG